MSNRRLHTITNLFIANLSLGDLLMTTFNIPFTVVRWFRQWLCHNFCIGCSLFMPEQLQPSDNSQLWFSIIFTNVKEFCDVIPLGPAYGVCWLPFVLTQFIFILTSLAILTHLKSWISIINDILRHWGSSFELEVFFHFNLINVLCVVMTKVTINIF